jgi:hypothetical protein
MNTLTIEGDKELIAEVGARLRAPIPDRDEQAEFAFWNIVKPEDSILWEYNSVCDMVGMANGNNWYNWNCRNWGVKWEARVTNSEIDLEAGILCYYFDTAWAPPLQVIELLSEQYPTLNITIRYIEEQGWGGLVHFLDGDESVEDEWDIPESHEEYEKAWDGDCDRCDDIGSLFQDCPAAIASQSHFTDIELLGECRWCEINEDGRYDDCPPNEEGTGWDIPEVKKE